MKQALADRLVWPGIASQSNYVQFVVATTTTRFWQIGDDVERGQLIGRTIDGDSVFSAMDGTVVGIQYDIDTDELILLVEIL